MLETLHYLIDLVLHLNQHLGELVNQLGPWSYVMLFTIIFCETGLVVTPFLPGDSLLFAAGSIAAIPSAGLNVHLLVWLLVGAALIGDNCNYWLGRLLGDRFFKPDARVLKTAYLDKTHNFYEKYGGKTIIIARFVPIVRTFAPFVAGMGSMSYRRFLSFSVFGALLWVFSISYLGYYFGNLHVVQSNFGLVILAIIFVSILPALIEIFRARLAARASAG
ncbi:DedA family protein [Dongshaea marina]|uniref:DedA family protein n=1 Tax=Dongshaea marina TaxID=2047966 RepID=UPI000D3E6C9E|nr:DedA family protein [Dongshaea marina]